MIEIIIIVQWKFKEKNYVAFDYFYFFPFFLCWNVLSGVDPYALIKCEGKTVRISTVKDTRNPVWNSAGALFYVRRPKKKHLVVQVSLNLPTILR